MFKYVLVLHLIGLCIRIPIAKIDPYVEGGERVGMEKSEARKVKKTVKMFNTGTGTLPVKNNFVIAVLRIWVRDLGSGSFFTPWIRDGFFPDPG
jgi:hypothetical protein